MKHAFSKIIAVLLLAAVFASGVPLPTTPKAHAVVPVTVTFSIPNAIGVALRHAAVIAAQTAVQSVTRSLVNWIHSGFDGSPAFERNLNVSLRQLADGVAAEVITGILENTSVDSPFVERAARRVAQGYLLYTSRDAIVERLRYTLGQYVNNDQAFLRGDFNQGGFNGWFALNQCGNDPYCVTYAIQEETARKIDQASQRYVKEFDAGRGFLSWRGACKNSTTVAGTEITTPTGDKVQLNDANFCTEYEIKTPGSTIADSVSFLSTQPELKLTVANSIDEVIAALASQLVSQVISSTGLLGAGSRQANTGRAALTQIVQPDVATTLSAGFLQEAQNQRTQVVTYQTAWNAIQVAATNASNRCTQSGAGTTGAGAEVALVLAQATAGVEKSTAALAALDSIITRATQVQGSTDGNQGSLISQLSNDYNCLVSGQEVRGGVCVSPTGSPIGQTCPVIPGVLPSASEISCAMTEGTDTGTSTPVSLLTRMNQVAASGCN